MSRTDNEVMTGDTERLIRIRSCKNGSWMLQPLRKLTQLRTLFRLEREYTHEKQRTIDIALTACSLLKVAGGWNEGYRSTDDLACHLNWKPAHKQQKQRFYDFKTASAIYS